MSLIVFIMVFINIELIFFSLLDKKPKKPVIEEELKKPKYSIQTDIECATILELLFSKKDGTTETFFIIGHYYWIEKDYIILILPDSLKHRMSIILDKKQIHNYTNKDKKLIDTLSYDSFNSICTNPDVLFIDVFNNSIEQYCKNGVNHNNSILYPSYRVSHIRWITESEPFNSWEEDDKKFQNYLLNKR